MKLAVCQNCAPVRTVRLSELRAATRALPGTTFKGDNPVPLSRCITGIAFTNQAINVFHVQILTALSIIEFKSNVVIGSGG
ncbi:hypothetical protein D3C81_1592100 [compost metagenome]